MENPVFKLEKVVRSKSEEMQDFEGYQPGGLWGVDGPLWTVFILR